MEPIEIRAKLLVTFLVFLARQFGGFMLFVKLPVFLRQLGEVGLDVGDPFSAALFRVSQVSAEAFDLVSELIPLDPELIRLTTQPIAFTLDDLLALGERGPELVGLIQDTLSVHGQSVVLGVG